LKQRPSFQWPFFKPIKLSNQNFQFGSSKSLALLREKEKVMKSTVTWQGRIKVVDAATLLKFFTLNKIAIRTRGEIISTAVDSLVDILVNNKLVEKVESDLEATRIIIEHGVPLATKDRPAKQLLKNLQGAGKIFRGSISPTERDTYAMRINGEFIDEAEAMGVKIADNSQMPTTEEAREFYEKIKGDTEMEKKAEQQERIEEAKRINSSRNLSTAEEEEWNREQERKEVKLATEQNAAIERLKLSRKNANNG